MSSSFFNNLIYGWICIGLMTFILLLKITAPYGRHSSASWGPLIGNRLGWILMEVPVIIVLVVFIWPRLSHLSDPALVMIVLFLIHYINRTFIFPFRLKTTGKKMPLVIVFSAVFFNLLNGFFLGYYFAFFENYSFLWFTDFRFITGLILFFGGLSINWIADNKLIHLRKPGQTHYVIPKGGLFNWISCPNLFGELLEWFGFALLCWNLPAISFFIWTAANLIPRALSHQKWYKEKFIDYPINRKAIIPFVI